MQTSCHLCLILCLLGWAILEFGGDLWESTNSLGPFLSPGLYPMGFFQAYLWTRVVIWFFALFPPLRILNAASSWSLQPRLLLSFTSLTGSFLFLSMRSRRVSSLVGFLITCVGILSSMHSRNFLDFLCHTISAVQQIPESANMRFLPVIWRTPVA